MADGNTDVDVETVPLKEVEEERASTKAKLQELKEELQALGKASQKAVKERDKAQAQFKETLGRVDSLTARLKKAEALLGDGDLETLRKERDTLRREVAMQQRGRAAAEKESREKDAQIEEHKKAAAAARHRADKMRPNLELMQNGREGAIKREAEAVEAVTTLTSERDAAREKSQDLKKELEVAQAKIKQLEGPARKPAGARA